jgi:hypothetical protein
MMETKTLKSWKFWKIEITIYLWLGKHYSAQIIWYKD